jgi:hypothetical protein
MMELTVTLCNFVNVPKENAGFPNLFLVSLHTLSMDYSEQVD